MLMCMASAFTYRAFGAIKGMNYANGRSLSTAYDNRLRPTTWNVAMCWATTTTTTISTSIREE